MKTPVDHLLEDMPIIDPTCCPTCARAFEIVKRGREEAERMQSASDTTGDVSKMRLQVRIDIDPSDTGPFAGKMEVQLPDHCEHPDKERTAAVQSIVHELMKEVLNLWAASFVSNDALKRCIQISSELEELGPDDESNANASHVSHLN